MMLPCPQCRCDCSPFGEESAKGQQEQVSLWCHLLKTRVSHSKIIEALKVSFSKVMLLDGRLMTDAQERTNLASKIFMAVELEQKMNSRNKWFLDAAKEADLEIDDGLVEDESNMSRKDQLLIKEAAKAKVMLQSLLSEPMKTQRFGKFLSTNSAVMQAEIKPLVNKDTKKSTRKKKKKDKKRDLVA
mmetsp:Transcript_14900/g.36234  ORF Transcript_14900/g.36234 Transcript_14900/m.36234 type:complete len:187 (-) Transcript_14900:111-671(-)